MHCSWLQYICWLSLVHGRCTIYLRQTSELDVNTAKNSTATVCLLLTGPPIDPCCLSVFVLDKSLWGKIVIYMQNVNFLLQNLTFYYSSYILHTTNAVQHLLHVAQG